MCSLFEREKQILHTLARERGRRVACHACLLTEAEKQVLHRIAEGDTINQIAGRLCLAPATVANHWKRICKKIGIDTRTAVRAFAVRRLR